MGVATRPSTDSAGDADASLRFVARQPIFDRERRLVGYELLYRAHQGAATSAGGASPVQMSSSTLVHGVLDIGLDQLTGPVPAWVNVPRDMLLSEALDVLPPKRVVLEILETVTPDAEVVAACQRLAAKGFTLALDDFVGGEEWEPLVRLAKIVKFDVLPLDEAALKPQIARVRRHGAKLLAERIEDQAAFTHCVGLGFDYFQGYHFRKPEVMQRKTLPVGMARIAKLMALVGNPNVSDADIEAELRGDPGLSVKLLRIVNNASTGFHGVSSLRHAIQLSGRRALHHWLAMLFVSSVPATNDVDREASLEALERGRFCELLALEQGNREQADPAFLVGLLARVDQRLGIPMRDLVQQLGVSEDVSAALNGEPGPHTPLLTLATAYAGGEWERVDDVARPLGVVEELPELYGEAGGWARQVMSAA
jgi:EAL and modified HD-GYP domain-containing signal transduction protein